jgi:hypothetical protein
MHIKKSRLSFPNLEIHEAKQLSKVLSKSLCPTPELGPHTVLSPLVNKCSQFSNCTHAKPNYSTHDLKKIPHEASIRVVSLLAAGIADGQCLQHLYLAHPIGVMVCLSFGYWDCWQPEPCNILLLLGASISNICCWHIQKEARVCLSFADWDCWQPTPCNICSWRIQLLQRFVSCLATVVAGR